jgi:hypothetical protein
MDCQSHLHQIGLGINQVFDDWDGLCFLHHPSNADCLSEVHHAESFAVIYSEDKIMPYVNPLYATDAIAKGGTQVADERIYRCMYDTPIVQPYINPSTGQVDGIANRTSGSDASRQLASVSSDRSAQRGSACRLDPETEASAVPYPRPVRVGPASWPRRCQSRFRGV